MLTHDIRKIKIESVISIFIKNYNNEFYTLEIRINKRSLKNLDFKMVIHKKTLYDHHLFLYRKFSGKVYLI